MIEAGDNALCNGSNGGVRKGRLTGIKDKSGYSTDRLSAANGLSYTYDLSGNVLGRGSDTTITTADDGTVKSIARTNYGTTTYMRDYRNLKVSWAGAAGSGTLQHDEAGNLVQYTAPEETLTCFLLRQQYTKRRTRHESYVHLAGMPVALIQTKIETPCNSTSYGAATWAVENSYFFYLEKMGVPRGVYRGSDTRLVWNAQLNAWGTPVSMNTDPDADGVAFIHGFRLPGQQALATAESGPSVGTGGLHENWWRIYDSAVGRYLESDPVGLYRAGGTNPINNLYLYADARSLHLIDPDGLTAIDKSCKRHKAQIKQGIADAIAYSRKCGKCGSNGGPFPERLKNATIYCDVEEPLLSGYQPSSTSCGFAGNGGSRSRFPPLKSA